MTRLYFRLPTITPFTLVRVDTDPGVVSPADVVTVDGNRPIPDSQIRADGNGALGNVLGPDGAARIYLKTLTENVTLDPDDVNVPNLTGGGTGDLSGAAGRGLAYDSGQLSILVSADSGNSVEFGSDEGLYVPAVVVDSNGNTVGTQGPSGPPGAPGAAATVTVGTVASGATAAVTNSGTASAATLDFVLPKGDQGLQGPPGLQGVAGDQGIQGVKGDPGVAGSPGGAGAQGDPGIAATVTVGTVTTGAAGSSATVTNSGTASAAKLDFVVPKGDQGVDGVTKIAAGSNVTVTGTGSATDPVVVSATGVDQAAVNTAIANATGTGLTYAASKINTKLSTDSGNALGLGTDGGLLVNASSAGAGPAGPPGSAATVAVGTTSTGNAGSNATVTNTGTASAAVLNFTLPRGADGAAGAQGIQGIQGVQGPSGAPGTPGASGADGAPGAPGTAATVTVGTVATGAPGSNATVTNTGTANAAVLAFTLPTGAAGPTGAPGAAATVTVGSTTTGAAGSSASVTNTGTSAAAVLNFTVPAGAQGAQGIQGTPGVQGDPGVQGNPGVAGSTGNDGAAATVTVGPTTTGLPGSSATVTNTGTANAAVLAFTIPQGVQGPNGSQGIQGIQGSTGLKGDTGNAATVAVGSTTTGAAGSSASVTNTGTSSAAVLAFTIPQGAQGAQGIQGTAGTAGAAATVGIGTTTTLAAGSSATVTNSGTASAAIFNFGIPKGADGSAATGGTGSAGAYVVAAAKSTTPLNAVTQAASTEVYVYGANVAMTAGRTYAVTYGAQIGGLTTGYAATATISLTSGAGDTSATLGTVLDRVTSLPTTSLVAVARGQAPGYTATATGTYTVKLTWNATSTWTDLASTSAPKFLSVMDITDAATSATVTPTPTGAYTAGPGTQVTLYGTGDDVIAGNGMTVSGSAGADGSETKLTAGAGATVAGTGTTASPYVVSASVPVPYPPIVNESGQYVYMPAGGSTNNVSYAIYTSNTTYMAPFNVAKACTLNSVYMGCYTFNAAHTLTLSLYTFSASAQTFTRVPAGALGTITVSASGSLALTGLTQTLSPGVMYFLFIGGNATSGNIYYARDQSVWWPTMTVSTFTALGAGAGPVGIQTCGLASTAISGTAPPATAAYATTGMQPVSRCPAFALTLTT